MCSVLRSDFKPDLDIKELLISYGFRYRYSTQGASCWDLYVHLGSMQGETLAAHLIWDPENLKETFAITTYILFPWENQYSQRKHTTTTNFSEAISWVDQYIRDLSLAHGVKIK